MKKIFKMGCLSIFLLFLAVLIFTITNLEKIKTDGDGQDATPSGKIATDLSITPEQAEKILEVFKSINIGDNPKITHDELLDNANFDGEKGYRVKTNIVLNVILYMKPDGTINLIKYDDNILYENNNYVASLLDFVVTKDEGTNLQIKCQETIKTILKAPSTAKFPSISEWGFGKKDGVTIVQGYVDSQNSFGAMIRSEFQFKIQNDKIISLIFEGKELMNK